MTNVGIDTPAVEEPLKAATNGPVVVVWGGHSTALGRTPEAALGTAAALVEAAQEAIRNRDAGQEPD